MKNQNQGTKSKHAQEYIFYLYLGEFYFSLFHIMSTIAIPCGHANQFDMKHGCGFLLLIMNLDLVSWLHAFYIYCIGCLRTLSNIFDYIPLSYFYTTRTQIHNKLLCLDICLSFNQIYLCSCYQTTKHNNTTLSFHVRNNIHLFHLMYLQNEFFTLVYTFLYCYMVQ